MAGRAKKLRDVCAVDFTHINHQGVPVQVASCCLRDPEEDPISFVCHELNGTSTQSKSASLFPNRSGSPAHRPTKSQASPSNASNGYIFTGRGTPIVSSHFRFAGGNPALDETVDPLVEEDFLLSDEDDFVPAMGQVAAHLGAETATSIVQAEVDRRWEDYEDILIQQHDAKDALKLLSAQRFDAHQHCQRLLVEIEETRTHIMSVTEEIGRRKRHLKQLKEKRQNVDRQCQLAQLRHTACQRALKSVPHGYLMNIAFDDDESKEVSAAENSPEDVEVEETPNFDLASVSATPVLPLNGHSDTMS